MIVAADIFALIGTTPVSSDTARATAVLNAVYMEVRRYLGYSCWPRRSYTQYLRSSTWGDGDRTGLEYCDDGNYWSVESDGDLFLPQRPVRSVASVHMDSGAMNGQGSGDYPSSALLVAGRDYFIDRLEDGISWSGKLRIADRAWDSKARSIKVVYDAGLSVDEITAGEILGPDGVSVSAIREAVLHAAVNRYQFFSEVDSGQLVSERLADWQGTYDSSGNRRYASSAGLTSEVKEMLHPFRRLGI